MQCPRLMPRVWVVAGYRNDLVSRSQKDGDHNYLLARRPGGWFVLLCTLRNNGRKYIRHIWTRLVASLLIPESSLVIGFSDGDINILSVSLIAKRRKQQEKKYLRKRAGRFSEDESAKRGRDNFDRLIILADYAVITRAGRGVESSLCQRQHHLHETALAYQTIGNFRSQLRKQFRANSLATARGGFPPEKLAPRAPEKCSGSFSLDRSIKSNIN